MITIGIFGPSEDQEVKSLQARLLHRGVHPLVIDLSKFPEHLSITITKDDIILDNYSLLDMKAAFLRGRGIKIPDFARYDENYMTDSPETWEKLYPFFVSYLQSEIKCQKIRKAIIEFFSSKRPLVNPLPKNDLHRLKTYLFWYLAHQGISVPAFTAGTSSKNLKRFALDAFIRSTGAVRKPLAGIYKTFLWDEVAWEGHTWAERGAFYQYYIKGDTIRCYVLAGKLIASAIIVHGDTVDSSMSQTGIKVIELPEKAKKLAEETAAVLELPFCGMDLMREEKTEHYYVIDCNISPMFVNFARLSCIDIPAKIADYLIECAHAERESKPKKCSLLNEAKDILAWDPDIRAMMAKKRVLPRKACLTMYTIGIIGQKNDEHVKSLVSEIENRKAKALIIDFFNFPKFNMLTIHEHLFYDDLHITHEVPLRDADLVYIRNFSSRAVSSGKTEQEITEKTSDEMKGLSLQFCAAKIMAEGIPVINDLSSSMFHRLKAYQYYLLHAGGITVPKTLVTNNLDTIHTFIADLDQRVIAKPNTSGAEVRMADKKFFEENNHILSSRPFIFQQYVHGKSYRAYLLGGRIVSMGEIHYNRTFVDWRERVDYVALHEPEDNLRKQIEKAVRILGLAYCAVDLEYDDYTRKYYLLDFNPSALFTGWSRLLHMNMPGLIAEYLLQVVKRDGQIWQET